MIEDLCATHKKAIFIIDSLSMLLTENEMEYDFEKTLRSDAPRMTSIFLRKMAQMVRPNKNILICILQKMDNQNAGPMSPKSKDGGGTKIQYMSNYKFDLLYKEAITNSEDRHVGNNVYFKCLHHPSKEGSGAETHFIHTFGCGIDKVAELVSLCVECGIIRKKGAWLSLPSGEQVQGMPKMIELIKNQPELIDDLSEQYLSL
jgi:recombination protein RecA